MTIELINLSSGRTGGRPEIPLLESKFLIAEAPPFWVDRPGLVTRVAEEPVTLITGRAGSGKTQLAAAWANDRMAHQPVAWVTLEREDNQPTTFWTYLIEAMRRAEPSLPEFGPLPPVEGIERSMLGRLATALCGLPQPITLVLDGVSQLAGQQWAADLDFVLRHADPGLRLVLVGRWDPPMPLHRYRLAGGLGEIHSGDLAFTAEEAARLLTLHEVELGEAALDALLEHTEGWAAGLRLCASALQNRADPDRVVETISGGDTAIAEYFTGEVLRVQSPEVRRFLLETSVLDNFTSELAEVVTRRADARHMLAALARENAFIQPVETGAGAGRYRYHRLFAELLRAQLIWEEPDQLNRLHLRASSWLLEQGAVVEATGHAAQPGEWAEAANVVVADYALGPILIDGTRGRLGGIFRTLPDGPDSAELTIVRAALAVADGRPEEAVERLARVDRLLRPDTGCDDALRLAQLLVAVHPLLAGDPEPALADIQEAETLVALMPYDRAVRHPELHLLLLAAKAAVQSRAGDVDAAVATLTEAAGCEVAGGEPVTIDCLGRLALIEAYQGRLNRAGGHARHALELAEQHGLDPERWPVSAQLALAWIEVERYDVDAADRHLRAAQARCQPGGEPADVAAYAIVKSRRLQERGELRGAMQALRDAEAARPAPPVWLARENTLARARMLITAGRRVEAALLLETLSEVDAPEVELVRAGLLLAGGQTEKATEIARTVADGARVNAPVAVDAWMLLAMRAAGDDDLDGAREALRRALRAAAPDAHRRTLHQAWAQLRRVLREDDELARQYQALNGTEPSARVAAERDTDPVLVESLSKREFEVLQGMAAMLPTEEIAASMFVSINTVKTHVRSILRKLSASRRNEAVRRARSLKLI